MNKRNWIILASVAVILILAFLIGGSDGSQKEDIFTNVKKGEFVIDVRTTGELEAKNSTDIRFESNILRSLGFYDDIKIDKLIAEGTVVDSGEFVAQLDKTPIANRMKELDNEITKLESQLEQKMIDTSLRMRELRNNLINQEFELEEKKIEVEQSIYEPPATQRQAQIALEKSQRAFRQMKNNYDLQITKAKAEVREVQADLNSQKLKVEKYMRAMANFTIMAPQPGMVIYHKGWRGKIETGSSVSPWDPIVAKLPDLSMMITKTYVNEIDISKLSEKQEATIGIDAFPEKSYTGNVVSVANIGEQLRNSTAKVYEVIIDLNESDSILKPAMTTQVTIITDILDDVLFLPLECVHSNDSMTYVFTKSNKQEVITGASNSDAIVIEEGLEEGQTVYLSMPQDPEDFKLRLLNKKQ